MDSDKLEYLNCIMIKPQNFTEMPVLYTELRYAVVVITTAQSCNGGQIKRREGVEGKYFITWQKYFIKLALLDAAFILTPRGLET